MVVVLIVLDSGYDLPGDVLNWIGCCYMNGIGERGMGWDDRWMDGWN